MRDQPVDGARRRSCLHTDTRDPGSHYCYYCRRKKDTPLGCGMSFDMPLKKASMIDAERAFNMRVLLFSVELPPRRLFPPQAEVAFYTSASVSASASASAAGSSSVSSSTITCAPLSAPVAHSLSRAAQSRLGRMPVQVSTLPSMV